MEEKELMVSTDRSWQGPYNTQYPNSPSTITQGEAVTLEDTGDEPISTGTEDLTVAVLVASSPSGWETSTVQLRGSRKYLFRHVHGPRLFYVSGTYPIVYEALEEDIGFGDDVIASVSPWPKLWQQEDLEPSGWRGAFYPTYHRKVIFSKTMILRTASLPRWKPSARIQMRAFESEND